MVLKSDRNVISNYEKAALMSENVSELRRE